MSNNDRNFYHWLVGYLDGCDPIDLIVHSGCPPREYEPEAKAIVHALPAINDYKEAIVTVHKIFSDYFGGSESVVGGIERYQDMGVKIFQAWGYRNRSEFGDAEIGANYCKVTDSARRRAFLTRQS